MADFSLFIRNGTVITPAGPTQADIGIADSKIVFVRQGQAGAALQTVDATGLHIFPGVLDSHVHFNEPGRADWEGIQTGSRALAAGGGTVFIDMPLNAHPPTIDPAAFDQKLAAAKANSVTDFALWGGLVPGNVAQLEPLAERGVVGFKAFMANSGIEDFPCVNERELREGMNAAARLRRLIAVHAESETITSRLAAECAANNKTSVRDYLASRPMSAELEAIALALSLAGETGCALHIVHVSCGAGIALIASARLAGVDVTCETCPHYLAFTEEDMEEIGALAKCAPPLRPQPAQEALWGFLQQGQLDTIGSDHSPSPPSMKTGENFFKVWGGISGVQHTLPLLLTEGHAKRRVPLELIAQLLSLKVANRFGLNERKGAIAQGMDADLALVDLRVTDTVEPARLFYRHPHTPYAGRALTGRVCQTILRGQTIFQNGKIIGQPAGKFLKPRFA